LVVLADDEKIRNGLELVEGLEDKFDILLAEANQIGSSNIAKVYCYCHPDKRAGSVFNVKLPTAHIAGVVSAAGFVRLSLSRRTEVVGLMYYFTVERAHLGRMELLLSSSVASNIRLLIVIRHVYSKCFNWSR
jgi:hypothetical protein